jgi:hypothetical protein
MNIARSPSWSLSSKSRRGWYTGDGRVTASKSVPADERTGVAEAISVGTGTTAPAFGEYELWTGKGVGNRLFASHTETISGSETWPSMKPGNKRGRMMATVALKEGQHRQALVVSGTRTAADLPFVFPGTMFTQSFLTVKPEMDVIGTNLAQS